MITRLDRKEVICMVERKEINKKSVLHYDVCKALQEGKTGEAVAAEFNIEPRHVRWIKSRKCSSCD